MKRVASLIKQGSHYRMSCRRSENQDQFSQNCFGPCSGQRHRNGWPPGVHDVCVTSGAWEFSEIANIPRVMSGDCPQDAWIVRQIALWILCFK